MMRQMSEIDFDLSNSTISATSVLCGFKNCAVAENVYCQIKFSIISRKIAEEMC